MIRLLRLFLRHQRGALAVETAIALPILIGVGLIGTDMQRIHTERIRLESTVGTLALNVAAQPELSQAGLNALADIAMQGHQQAQHLIILSVQPSGRINWALQRGGSQGLCAPPSAGGLYTGTLPENDPTAPPAPPQRNNGSSLSLVVVVACRNTQGITLTGGLTLPDTLESRGIYRASNPAIKLDPTLQAESDASGLAFPASSN